VGHVGRRGLAIIAASARVHPTAVIVENDEGTVQIGANTDIGPHVVLGPDVSLGEDCKLGAGIVMQNTSVGDRCVFHPGSCFGQDGFGFHIASAESADHAKKPQTLRVVVGNDVEIGANCTVDRGSWRDTTISDGTKMDNLIQVGHNVQIGSRCLIAAQVGIAGSTTIGNFVLIGGQAGIAQHLQIGNGVQIAAKSGVMTDLKDYSKVGGVPAVPIRQFHKQSIILRRLVDTMGSTNTGSTAASNDGEEAKGK